MLTDRGPWTVDRKGCLNDSLQFIWFLEKNCHFERSEKSFDLSLRVSQSLSPFEMTIVLIESVVPLV